MTGLPPLRQNNYMKIKIFNLIALVICWFMILPTALTAYAIVTGQKVDWLTIVAILFLLVFLTALAIIWQAKPGTQIEINLKEGWFKLRREK